MSTKSGNGEAAKMTILNLLSDEENAKVSAAEGGMDLADGDEFIDLDDLESGVQGAADLDEGSIGHVLPKSAISAATWSKIVSHLKG